LPGGSRGLGDVYKRQLLDIVTGAYNPTGKMPFTTPVSQAAVDGNKSDVPGYMEGPGYGLFQFGLGLSY
jgi:beta-glucosidase